VTCSDPVLSFGCIAVADPLECSDPLAQWARLGAPGCGQVFAAPYVGEGDQCEPLPCDEGLYCKRGPSSRTCRVCAARAAPGAACRDLPTSSLHLPCEGGYYCDPDQDVCLRGKDIGVACRRGQECARGFCRDGHCAAPLQEGEDLEVFSPDQCSGFLVWRGGKCAVRLAQGQACDTDVDCHLDAVCAAGLCTPREVCAQRAAGEPCVTEPLGCVAGTFCNDTGAVQTCEAVRPLGQPCEFTDDCVPGAYCSFGDQVCTAYSGVGGSCEGALLCASGLYCDDLEGSLCATLQPEGAACDYGFECASGYCDPATAACAPQPACTMP
ncbi:MAG: hypothetical protein HY901_28990, partial [Deltaproteobacteria bacterium]|nr:hypothetical protein [Deltaproteobacteria bacterium]